MWYFISLIKITLLYTRTQILEFETEVSEQSVLSKVIETITVKKEDQSKNTPFNLFILFSAVLPIGPNNLMSLFLLLFCM